jgi:hypothetical protein
MVNEKTLVEKTDFQITFRTEHDNKSVAQHIYKEASSTCQLQGRKTIYNIHQHLRKRATCVFAEADKEDTKFEMDNEIMDEVAKFPATSTCRTAAAQRISRLTAFLPSAVGVRPVPTRLLPE